jgi:hypothetical protein
MGESLNKIHDELISRLYKPLIFYIPRKFWVELDGDKWKHKRFDEVFDTVVLMKSDGNNQVLNNDPSYFYILSKTTDLDKNIYTLLDMQAKLEANSFKFLIDKYNQHVNFYVRISTWLFENVQKDILEVTQEALKSFKHQRDAFIIHLEYIQNSFINNQIKPIKPFNTSLTDEDIKSIRGLINNASEVNKLVSEIPKSSESLIKFEPIRKTQKEKKILVTDEEAEVFLLKTVFHLEI